jgi:hypothetical protein
MRVLVNKINITFLIAVAWLAFAVLPFRLVVVIPAPLAVGAVPVAGAVQAVTSMTRLLVELSVEETPVREPIAVAC